MEKKKKISKFSALGALLIGMGCVLILLSAFIACKNHMEARKAGEEAGEALPAVQEEIRKAAEKPRETQHINPYDLEAEKESEEMTVMNFDGNDYIGWLSIPAYELELPVISEWSYPRLQIAPCRQFGSTKTDNLVIAAHNYSTHFGHLQDMKQGEEVFFTDMDGERTAYYIDSVGVISPDALDLIQNSGYDLVLYTCTFGGASRVMAGCYRQETEQTEP